MKRPNRRLKIQERSYNSREREKGQRRQARGPQEARLAPEDEAVDRHQQRGRGDQAEGQDTAEPEPLVSLVDGQVVEPAIRDVALALCVGREGIGGGTPPCSTIHWPVRRCHQNRRPAPAASARRPAGRRGRSGSAGAARSGVRPFAAPECSGSGRSAGTEPATTDSPAAGCEVGVMSGGVSQVGRQATTHATLRHRGAATRRFQRRGLAQPAFRVVHEAQQQPAARCPHDRSRPRATAPSVASRSGPPSHTSPSVRRCGPPRARPAGNRSAWRRRRTGRGERRRRRSEAAAGREAGLQGRTGQRRGTAGDRRRATAVRGRRAAGGRSSSSRAATGGGGGRGRQRPRERGPTQGAEGRWSGVTDRGESGQGEPPPACLATGQAVVERRRTAAVAVRRFRSGEGLAGGR